MKLNQLYRLNTNSVLILYKDMNIRCHYLKRSKLTLVRENSKHKGIFNIKKKHYKNQYMIYLNRLSNNIFMSINNNLMKY